MNPYLLAACLAAGFGAGWQVQAWRWGSADAERLAAQVQQAQQQAVQVDVAASSNEATKERIRVQFQTIYRDVDRVVEKPVYRDVCLDDDGMRVLRSAIGGADPASEPAPAVPGSGPAR